MCPQPRAAGKGKTFVSAASGAAASATWDGADDYVLACVGHLVSRPAPFSMNVPKTLAESAVLAGEIIAIFRAVSAVHTSSDSGTMATTEAPWLPALRPGPTPTGDCSAGDPGPWLATSRPASCPSFPAVAIHVHAMETVAGLPRLRESDPAGSASCRRVHASTWLACETSCPAPWPASSPSSQATKSLAPSGVTARVRRGILAFVAVGATPLTR